MSLSRRRAFESSSRYWSGVELSYEDFSAHLDHHGWPEEPPPHVEALYLCAACGLGSRPGCARLERDYFRALAVSLMQRYPRRDFVEDLLQQTRERLLVGPAPRIRTYRGDGSLASWLRRVTSHLAVDSVRRDRARPQKLAEWRRHQALLSSDSTSVADAARSERLERVLTEALFALDEAQRRLLQLYYVERVKVPDIARCARVDRATAYRRLHLAERRLRREVMNRLPSHGLTQDDDLDALRDSGFSGISLRERVWCDVTGNARLPLHDAHP